MKSLLVDVKGWAQTWLNVDLVTDDSLPCGFTTTMMFDPYKYLRKLGTEAGTPN